MSIDPRGAVKDVRAALLDLHRALIELERVAHEREFGRIERPAELLDLVMNGDAFAWLRPMSALIVSLDEALELEEFTHLEAVAARSSAEALLATESHPFHDKYLAALQDHDVVVAHARTRQAIAVLPRG